MNEQGTIGGSSSFPKVLRTEWLICLLSSFRGNGSNTFVQFSKTKFKRPICEFLSVHIALFFLLPFLPSKLPDKSRQGNEAIRLFAWLKSFSYRACSLRTSIPFCSFRHRVCRIKENKGCLPTAALTRLAFLMNILGFHREAFTLATDSLTSRTGTFTLRVREISSRLKFLRKKYVKVNNYIIILDQNWIKNKSK